MSNCHRSITTFLLLLIGAIVIATAPLGASVRYADYRGVTLGDSVDTVVARLQVERSAIRVIHEQPSLIQELTFRPNRYISGQTITPDTLAEMVLTFHKGELVRVAATYDLERTQGLTDADLIELTSGVYGLSLLPSTGSAPASATLGRRTIGSWGDGATFVQLWSEEVPRRAGLTVTAQIAGAVLDEASTIAARREADAAPQRERDRLAAVAAAIVVRDANIRLENKAKFKP